MEETETTTETETVAKGRPRPAATVELDGRVLEFITNSGDEGVTKESIAAGLEQPENKVYLALYRLRTTEQIHKVRQGRTSVWKVGVKPVEEAPVEANPEA
jgi:hypothetical protein